MFAWLEDFDQQVRHMARGELKDLLRNNVVEALEQLTYDMGEVDQMKCDVGELQDLRGNTAAAEERYETQSKRPLILDYRNRDK